MAELILYYSPGACSLAPHAALHEWGAPFEARPVLIAKGETTKPDYLALNPRGRVPLLVIDGAPISENTAILTWIGQQSGLYPEAHTIEAAKCGEWLGWLASSVHIAFAQIWRGPRFSDDAATLPAIRQRGYDAVHAFFNEIDAALQGRDYVLGDRLSIADFNLLPYYRWGGRIGLDMSRYPNWGAHMTRMMQRPSVRKAFEVEAISPNDTLPLPDGVRSPQA